MRRAALPKWRAKTRRLMPTRVKREDLENNEAEPGGSPPITLQ
jgi:hypothetical protein